MTWMVLVLALGATARLTRLIGRDSITFFFRDWLAARGEDSRDKRAAKGRRMKSLPERFFTFVEDMVTCPWCLSVWVSAPVAVLAWLYGETVWFVVPAIALTASHLTGLVMTKGED